MSEGPAGNEPSLLHGRFRVQREIARGGMGVVLEAVDESSGRRVALKQLLPGATPQIAALFEREYYLLASIRHPCIIEAYDYGVDETHGAYYTMELLGGVDLRDSAPRDPATVCRHLRDVASALALLHARRLVHRDVSARNVRLLPGGTCKLIDFGAVASFGATQDVVGTPPAIAPEALFGQPLDERSDLYALGALGYFLLTGRHAYPARRLAELPDVWTTIPSPPSVFTPDVPPELDDLILSLLRHDLLARPGSATEVLVRLGGIDGTAALRDSKAAAAHLVGASLVERDHELGRLTRRLGRLGSGQGSALFVDGAEGVGKTRLLTEMALKAKLAGYVVLQASGARQVGPLSTLRALLHHFLWQSPSTVRQAAAGSARILTAAWAEMAEALDPDAEDAPSMPPAAASAARSALPSVLESTLLRAAEARPLVLIVDDVDRSDPESAALLLTLARASKDHPICLVTAGAAGDRASSSPAVAALREAGAAARLRNLSRKGVGELLESAFGDIAHLGRAATHLFDATDGNPARCMDALGRWVKSRVVSYNEGTWVLPLDPRDLPLPASGAASLDVLRSASPLAQEAACLLALLGRPAPLSFCLAALGATERRSAIEAVEELIASGLVASGVSGNAFAQESAARVVAGAIPAEKRADLHARIARTLLSEGPGAPELELEAGHHAILGGDEEGGAVRIATTAHRLLGTSSDPGRLFARHAEALEAALSAYARLGKGNLDLLKLLVPLASASHDMPRGHAMLHGEEAISRLERALGLPSSLEGDREVEEAVVFAGLSRAPVLQPGEQLSAETPDVVALVSWLIRVVVTSTAVASAAIDHEREERYVRALQPFRHLGPDHPAAVAHEYCSLILSMTVDRMEASHRGWASLLARLGGVPLPPSTLRAFRTGALYCLGVLECQRDDGLGLARLEELDRLGSQQGAAVANQLRFLYHGFRGELALAEKCRERVEAFAMQRGSAWQVEIWSTCTLAAVYGNTLDRAGSRRVVDQLDHLRKAHPSLTVYWQRAVATQHLLAGDPKSAARVYEEALSGSAPRQRVGWSAVRGALARAYNRLGQHEVARRLCLETIELSLEDRDYVAMNLGTWLELIDAQTALGAMDDARGSCDELFERHRDNENPMTLGSLHRVRARLALRSGDREGFESHLAEMGRWFRRTGNPALIAQVDELRALGARRDVPFSVAGASPVTVQATAASLVQSVLAECRGPAERTRRALEMVAHRAGSPDAWLFTPDDEQRPRQVAQLGVAAPPDEVLQSVRDLFARHQDESEATSCATSAANPIGSEAPLTSSEPQSRHHLFPLTVHRGPLLMLVGVIAVARSATFRGVSHSLLLDVGDQLYQAGDVGSVLLAG